MNEAMPMNYFRESGLLVRRVSKGGTSMLKWILTGIWKKILKTVKSFWQYLKDQNEMAIDHHRYLRNVKDDIYSKNYWAIR